MIQVRRNVAYTTGYGCWFCLHIGTVVCYVGQRRAYGYRLEVLTPRHWFRWTRGE